MKLVVIMSTYNGEKYLAAQLDSILQQTVSIDTILIRDDGSQDKTLELLRKYQEKHKQIRLIQDTLGNIGVKKSYPILLEQAVLLKAEYLMFADQDDVWEPYKTSRLMEVIRPLNNTEPHLLFSDAKLVDLDLKCISPSWESFQKLNFEQACSLKALLLYSPALGCTMLFNAKLAELLLSCSGQFLNPDKWALMMAAVFGHVHYLHEALILYRQHDKNVTAALQGGVHRKFMSRRSISFLKNRYQNALDEARLFLEHASSMDSKSQKQVEEFIFLFKGNYFQRFLSYCQFYTIPPHWSRKLGLFLSLFFRYR